MQSIHIKNHHHHHHHHRQHIPRSWSRLLFIIDVNKAGNRRIHDGPFLASLAELNNHPIPEQSPESLTIQDCRHPARKKMEAILSGVVMHPFATPFSANMMPSRQESRRSLQKIQYPTKKQNSRLDFFEL